MMVKCHVSFVGMVVMVVVAFASCSVLTFALNLDGNHDGNLGVNHDVNHDVKHDVNHNVSHEVKKTEISISSEDIEKINDELTKVFLSEKKRQKQGNLRSESKSRQRRGTATSSERSYPITADSFGGMPGFYHGVASGDPLTDRVIVWTRYTPMASGEPVHIELRMAQTDLENGVAMNDLLDPAINEEIHVAEIEITAESDYVAKVDVVGLQSNSHYVFAFTDGSVASDVGQTRTAPSEEDALVELNYAFFSCANFARGYFHPYDVASTLKDLDFWIHLGDFIYEYANFDTSEPNLPEREALVIPEWELAELQDYRNRYATYTAHDEGLRNLRRRAPVIQVWDDHEFTDNTFAYRKRREVFAGGLGHQEVCPVNSTASDAEKNAANCDRDEGEARGRFTQAAQAFMEWMPLRRGPEVDGAAIDLTSISQVIEWGSLATLVGVDTRVADRSAGPSLNGFSHFDGFLAAAAPELNISAYYDPSSPISHTIQGLSQAFADIASDPDNTMLGKENRQLILDAFEESSNSGKPWQIFLTGSVMGPQFNGNLDELKNYAPPPLAPIVQAYSDAVLPSPEAALARAMLAMEVTSTPISSDNFDGFVAERALLLDGFMKKATNPIVLSGDSHNSYAYTLFENGALMGTPAAVNLGTPGVTSLGLSRFVGPVLIPLAGILQLPLDAVFDMANALLVGENNSLKYANIHKRGFVAVKATMNEHNASFIHFDDATIVQDFTTARAASGGITASSTCSATATTVAGDPASPFVSTTECMVEYDTMRPAEWDIPVPLPVDGEIDADDDIEDCGFDACNFKLAKAAKQVRRHKKR